MALSFSSVKKAYEVFNEIKKRHLPELRITTYPEDMSDWTKEERKSPRLNVVYGWDRKSDNGWENIFFFTKDPSQELKDKFESLKGRVPNSSMCRPDKDIEGLWIFGWF